MNHIDKENILPTPEPSSDAYNGLDEGVRKYAPARKPALKMAYMKPALNSTAEIGKSDQFGGLERLAELAGLATPPPSSPVRSQSPMRALASSPPSLPDFSSRIHSQSRGAVALSREYSEASSVEDTRDIYASPTRTLVLGRGKQDWKASRTARSQISPRIDRVRHYVFPSSYAHISRTHLSVEPNVKHNTFTLRVFGRNGVKVNEKHFGNGVKLRVSKSRSAGLTISCLMPHKFAKKPRYKLVMKSLAPSLNIALGRTRLVLHWSDLVHHKSVLSDCESDESDEEAVPGTPSKRKRAISTGVDDVKEEEGDVEISPDHLGLIAQTLALNVPTSLTPVKEIVSCLLANNPSLEKEGDREQWEEIVQRTLLYAPGEMFGCVERSGRDAANRPLPNLYYYQPSNDPDRVRAQSLAPLTRVPRLASRASQAKSIFWKPVSIRPKKKW